jgi:hypothetical protein
MTRLQVSTLLLSGALALLTVVQPVALAGRWEARQEAREGYREAQREKREARREVRRELRDQRGRPYPHGRWHDARDDDDLLKGVAIGAAVVGIGAAIANSAQDEY